MPFPVVHLRVAEKIARALCLSDGETASFLLGSLAPDGVHYRAGLEGAPQHVIGAEKKHTHLCHESSEPWGKITDNDGWLVEINRVWSSIPKGANHLTDPFVAGYVVHVLTDVYNNLTLWKNFCAGYPEEAENVYTSDYYREMGALDLQLYQEPETERVIRLLPQAETRGFDGRIAAEEAEAIRASILYESGGIYTRYKNQPPADTSRNRFITFAQIKGFIENAAAFALQHLPVL
ncbi:MAG: hypothetical protein FWD90_09105 [Defluviitaleaceae bacterium]|nr:hypothetical protein [Defluviitaleaceae bacterium]